MGRRIPPSMTKYLYRTCPKSKDYLGVVVREPTEPVREIPISAYWLRCRYKLDLRMILRKGTAFTDQRELL